MKKVVIAFLCMFCLLFCLTGCSKKQEKNIDNKLDSELEYQESLIFKIANKHAKGEYFEDDKVNWEYIKGDIQKINQSWNSAILDLTEVNVANEEIMSFSTELNELLISFSEENESKLLEKLNNLYAKIVVFKEAYCKDANEIKKNKIKSDVLEIYSLVNKNDFTGAKAKAASTVETYKGLMNDMSYVEENSYNLNKIYVLLEEYSSAIQTENYDLIRMKYILTVENL